MSEWKDSEIGQIPDNWEVTTIDDIAEIVTDGAHMSPKLFHGGRYMASVKDMTYDRFDFSECKTISQIDFEVLKNQGCSPRIGDILISKDGEKCLDLIFVYNQKEQIVLLSSIAIVRLKEGYNPNFYRYFLLSYVAQTIMYKWFRSGSAIPRVVLRDFKKVPVPLILKTEQDNISTILENLDQKIALLRQQNQTLEELAQTLFKRWFVEFEFPNEHGEPYKSSGGKMVESELGEIPVGWRVGKLSELLEIKYGKDHKHLEDGKYPLYGSGGIMRFVEKALYDKPSILIPRKGTLTNIYYLEQPFWSVDTMFYSKIKMSNYGKYCYQLLKRVNFSLLDVGSAIPSLTIGLLNEMEILIPDEVIVSQFENALSSLFNKMNFNNKETDSLSQLRDTLLPKLMSGELRVNI